jgi:hypothetical protein
LYCATPIGTVTGKHCSTVSIVTFNAGARQTRGWPQALPSRVPDHGERLPVTAHRRAQAELARLRGETKDDPFAALELD